MRDGIVLNEGMSNTDVTPLTGLTGCQLATLTGMGRRNIVGCQNVDTVAAKFRAGALSVTGVMSVIFGVDSPEHHAGRVLA